MTTSFTINYDEKTTSSFIDGMAERNIPLRVFHFDCYWIKVFHCTGNRLLPVFVRKNTVLAMGENDQLPDYEYADAGGAIQTELEVNYTDKGVI